MIDVAVVVNVAVMTEVTVVVDVTVMVTVAVMVNVSLLRCCLNSMELPLAGHGKHRLTLKGQDGDQNDQKMGAELLTHLSQREPKDLSSKSITTFVDKPKTG